MDLSLGKIILKDNLVSPRYISLNPLKGGGIHFISPNFNHDFYQNF